MLRRRRLIVGLIFLAGVWLAVTLIWGKSKRAYFSSEGIKIHSNKQSEYIDKNGMHVVVGKYVGDSLDTPSFTADELNHNGYRPDPNAGDQGQPVFLERNQDVHRAKRLWHINKFNVVVSDRINVNRSLQDVRKAQCREKNYTISALPDASIIIVFHNEAWSTLMRTIISVINRSPRQLVKEVILVDDASNRTYLGQPLEKDVSGLSVPVHILRAPERMGLIKARLLGAQKASAKVLLFLDAHCEATKGWLEPLLARISEKRNSVVCPVIDIIHDDNFSYIKSFSLHWGAFNWELHFRWFTMGRSVMDTFVKSGGTDPFSTPAMAGGLFAIDRSYFYEMGSYDEAMDIWGGENLEMSFRLWMCGGSVEIAPCSHVGHVFRKASPYTFPREGGVNHVLHTNLARVASVWLDDHASFYFRLNPRARKEAETQDVSQRRKLRTDLQCKTFQWYLDNIWPENFLPSESRLFGKIKHTESGKCLQRPPSPMPMSSQLPRGSQTSLHLCADKFQVYQQMVMNVKSNGTFIMTDESMCLDVPNYQEIHEASARFAACNTLDRQKWRLEGTRLVHSLTDQCLTYVTEGTSDQLVLKACKSRLPSQQFEFVEENWK